MNGIKPSWPSVFFIPRKGEGPAKRRKQKVNEVLAAKDAKTRQGIIAELMANEKREIEEARALRERVKRERAAVDAAAASLPPEARCKIVRMKDGSIALKRKDRGEKGKFLPNVKVNL